MHFRQMVGVISLIFFVLFWWVAAGDTTGWNYTYTLIAIWLACSFACKAQMIFSIRVKFINIISIVMYLAMMFSLMAYKSESHGELYGAEFVIATVLMFGWPIVDGMDLANVFSLDSVEAINYLEVERL
jgi:hypothetical protein